MDPAERLRPYVAGLAATWCEAMPEVRHRGVSGTLAFVDISGFTTLTERLAAKGKVGAEEMSDLLNESFATLLKVAYGYGASLVKWGGDAVLLLYEGDDHAAQGCRAALEMQRTMRRIGRLRTSVGVVALKMSVGISSGMFDFFLVGDRHRELVVVGPTATETAVMEQIAEAGEVVVSAATAALLPVGCLGPAKETGWLLRTPPPADPRSRWWPRVDASYVATCLDPALREHLLAEVGDSEHRQVAVGFIEVSGIDELLEQQGPAATAGALHQLMNVVQDACAHHRVTFWETDISKDGFKILLIGGAPKTSGHDEDAMLRASRWILDTYSGPVRLRIGVNTGRVFNGGFGPPFRRTWSVKGDAVNLAARVMAKAEPGQLLATEALLRRVAGRVDADLLPTFMVKGKQQPVRAAVVHRVTRERAVDATPTGAFVGRQAEVDRLLDAARAAHERRGVGVVLIGEAGIGKSRLVDHACRRVPQQMTVLRGFGDEYESSTPYFAVRRPLLAAIGLAQDATDEQIVAALRRKMVGRAGRLESWLPLLALPFGVDLADTAETAVVAEQFRRSRTQSLVSEFLAVLLNRPTVLVVDDVQNVDDASAELLARLAGDAHDRAWLFLLVGRELPPALRDCVALETLVVPALSSEDARELVLDAAGDEPMPPHVVRAIVARAEGNPLFLNELTAGARSSDGDDLPATVEELLSARIDDLSPEQRRLLRTVSVLGTRFDPSLTSALVDDTPTAEQWAALDHFLAVHADGSRRFRTGLARDAAYEGLPFRRRVELHGRAATALERLAAEDGEDRAEALSLHCLAAQRFEDAWRHSLMAGERARRVYANADAVTFYRRALTASRRFVGLSSTELVRLHETLGDVLARLAELDNAAASYRAARRLVPSTEHATRARLALSIALVYGRVGSTPIWLRWLTTAARELGADTGQRPGNETATLEARVLVERAYVRYLQGFTAEAASLCRRATAVAADAGADQPLARALHLSDLVAISAGQPGDDAPINRALMLFERAGDRSGQAGAWNHLGIRAYYDGQWDRAVERYRRAEELWRSAGDEWNAAIAAGNVAEILTDQGRLREAEPLVASALQVWRASATSDVGFVAALLGRVRCRGGKVFEGLALLTEAVAAYAAMNQRSDVADAQLRIVEALLLSGAADVALDRLHEAEATLRLAARSAGVLASDAEHSDSAPPALPQASTVERLRGIALVQRGDASPGRETLTRAVELARAGSSLDLALSLDALLWAAPSGDYADQRRELVELRHRLGIVWLPTFPGERAAVSSEVLTLLPRQRVPADDPVTA